MSRQSRIIIYAKDIATILGTSDRTGRNILIKIRRALNKSPRQPITITEFCDYMNLNRTEVESSLHR